MSRNVCLLTFNRLPNRQLAGEDSLFTPVFEKLDSTTAFFEQHYLQLPDTESILGHSETTTALESFVVRDHVSAVVINLSSEACESAALIRLPKSFRQAIVSQISEADQHCADGSIDQFIWLNCSLHETQTEAEQVAEFDRCLEWCRKQTQSPNSLLLITSTCGHEPPEMPFETVLFDGSVRVPLWIEFDSKQASRVQSSTGSLDVLQTALQWLQDSPDDFFDQPDETISQPISLAGLARTTGISPARMIDIRTPKAVAIRTNDFMFCQKNDDEQNSPDECYSQPGLYSKPEDLWNIRNVSGEYHDLIHDFQSRLTKSK